MSSLRVSLGGVARQASRATLSTIASASSEEVARWPRSAHPRFVPQAVTHGTARRPEAAWWRASQSMSAAGAPRAGEHADRHRYTDTLPAVCPRVASPQDSRAVIETVESIYEGLSTLTPAGWLARTLESIHKLSAAAVGGYAYGYDLSGAPESWTLSRPIVSGMPEEIGASIYGSFVASPPVIRRGLLRLGPSGTLSEKAGLLLTDLPAEGASAARSLGVVDAMHVNALDPNGRGVLLALALAEPTRLPPQDLRRSAMIAAHVAGARRLLLSGSSEAPPAAIFERDGAVAEVARAHEAAIPTLKERLLHTEKMRNRSAATDADEVLESWQALVAGKYTLIGRFDSDGRRYVMAYENAPNVRDPRGLSELEAAVAGLATHGHAQKFIAYELGLAVGTVGGILSRIYRKLGIASRAELVELLTTPSRVERCAEGDREVLLFSLPAAKGSLDALTPAERGVALAAISGESNAAIARTRQTSVRTVEAQLRSVMRKVGVGSRAELAAYIQGRTA